MVSINKQVRKESLDSINIGKQPKCSKGRHTAETQRAKFCRIIGKGPQEYKKANTNHLEVFLTS